MTHNFKPYRKEWNAFIESVSRLTRIPIQDLKLIISGKNVKAENYQEIFKERIYYL